MLLDEKHGIDFGLLSVYGGIAEIAYMDSRGD